MQKIYIFISISIFFIPLWSETSANPYDFQKNPYHYNKLYEVCIPTFNQNGDFGFFVDIFGEGNETNYGNAAFRMSIEYGLNNLLAKKIKTTFFYSLSTNPFTPDFEIPVDDYHDISKIFFMHSSNEIYGYQREIHLMPILTFGSIFKIPHLNFTFGLDFYSFEWERSEDYLTITEGPFFDDYPSTGYIYDDSLVLFLSYGNGIFSFDGFSDFNIDFNDLKESMALGAYTAIKTGVSLFNSRYLISSTLERHDSIDLDNILNIGIYHNYNLNKNHSLSFNFQNTADINNFETITDPNNYIFKFLYSFHTDLGDIPEFLKAEINTWYDNRNGFIDYTGLGFGFGLRCALFRGSIFWNKITPSPHFKKTRNWGISLGWGTGTSIIEDAPLSKKNFASY